MFENIMKIAMESGLMAVLFVGLLIFVIRDTAKREKKYQEIIDELSEDLKIVHQIYKDVTTIKENIDRKY